MSRGRALEFGDLLERLKLIMVATCVLQLEKFSLQMFCFFLMECRRWALICRGASSFYFPDLSRGLYRVDGWTLAVLICRDAGEYFLVFLQIDVLADMYTRIVEYATRDQAQNAVNTLSNQSLMGRLVYVREVCLQRFHGVGVAISTDFSPGP